MTQNKDKLSNSSTAFYMSGRMISIRLPRDPTSSAEDEIVKGRVFLYDDQTKTLILKIFEPESKQQIGMGLYNSQNIQLEKIHVLEDIMESDEPLKSKISEELETQHLIDEYSVNEDAYSRLVME